MADLQIVEDDIEAIIRSYNFVCDHSCLEAVFGLRDTLLLQKFAIFLKEDELDISLIVAFACDQQHLVRLRYWVEHWSPLRAS